MFANRVKKNLRHLKKWRQREHINCYRLYDSDIPEYAVAIDVYEGAQCWLHVQEYEAPKTIAKELSQRRLDEAVAILPSILEIPQEQLYLKVRRQQKGKNQYEKLSSENQFHEVIESELRFLVNFSDYLDTGLFIDHRMTRACLRELADGKHFLNLFAYTGSATVYAADGGALSTTTIDMSKTYLEWAQRNMALNGFSNQQHIYQQHNCIEWLQLQQATNYRRYGLIFLDPPSFSTSKRMKTTFDVQRDHGILLQNTAKLLDDEGILIFSNNRHHFKMDDEVFAQFTVSNITKSTLPKDFERNPRIHQCWKIQNK